MTQASAMTMMEPGDTGQMSDGQALIHRLRFFAGMGFAVVVFTYVGFWAAKSADPLSPITLISVDQGVIAMAELLALGVVASGLAVAICGAGSAERGALAIAVGLAAMAMRGTQLDMLVLRRLSVGPGSVDPFPATALVAETWLWLALIAVGFVVGRWVDSWFDSGAGDAAVTPVDRAPDVRQGLGAIAVVSLVGWTVTSYALGGGDNPLFKGQIYFAIALGFLVGAMAANWLFHLQSRVWLLTAVAIVATAAYLLAGPDSREIEAARKAGTYLTLAPMVRPLPIEYAALGSIGALLERDAMSVLRSLFGLPPQTRA